ncbi:MAG: hypothetical protein KDJ50_09830 [Alphaproteobacteria bacterium]|nr:hypothetical protein [Alphaproteobacteria bacterium]
MPHIIAELNNNLLSPEQERQLLNILHNELAKEPSVDLDRIKTRAVHLSSVLVGNESLSDNMLHITVKLLEGRSIETRKTIALSIQNAAQSYLQEQSIQQCKVTVDIVEMISATYAA